MDGMQPDEYLFDALGILSGSYGYNNVFGCRSRRRQARETISNGILYLFELGTCDVDV
jgi:hypothetical protein